MLNITRRSLIKLFGLVGMSVCVPRIGRSSEPKIVFNKFSEWLTATTKAVKDGQLNYFTIRMHDDHLRIKGASAALSGSVTFEIAEKDIPKPFAYNIRKAQGRKTFARWITSGTFATRGLNDFYGECNAQMMTDREAVCHDVDAELDMKLQFAKEMWNEYYSTLPMSDIDIKILS